VSKIYAVSEVYMMQDKSADKQATWDFVERRIAEVMRVGAFLNKNKDLTSAVGGGVASII
jgi:ubiquinone biosynthesis protein COQ9